MWSTPCSRATSTVRSLEPSSITSHSTESTPGTSRGRSASVPGSVASSLKHGIWMISFMTAGRSGGPAAPATHLTLAAPMESATLTRPRRGSRVAARLRAVPAAAWARAAFGVLTLTTLLGFVVYPTYPNYDSYYSLIWGREVAHLHVPSFEAYRGPTEHPLAIAFGAVLSLLGRSADRVLVGLTLVSFLVLVWGVYRLGRVAFTPLVGGIAAALLVTRFDFPFLAARGYIDIPYLALVIWAAVLEAERPRRGAAVLVLLAAAGTMRPEAWILIALYYLWVAWPADWPTRARYAALAAVGPALWMGVDAAVTGDPLWSIHHTTGLAEELGRSRTLSQIPSAIPFFLNQIVKLPVLIGGGAGLVLALWIAPRRVAMPLTLLVTGLGTFVLVGLAGLSVIERYLIVPSLGLLIFAAVAVGGWTMLVPGTALRRIWALGAVAIVVFGVVFTATHVKLSNFFTELRFRGDSHAALVRTLDDPKLRAGLRCGPLSVPNHKLIPDTRWLLDLPRGRVVARTDKRARGAQRSRGGAVRARAPGDPAPGLQPGERPARDPDPRPALLRAGGRQRLLLRLCPLSVSTRRPPARR